jgi:SulP family sulfate permease
MAEKQAFATLVRSSWGDAVVVIATFALTVFVGLTPAIVVGFALGTLLFLHRMARSANVEAHVPLVPEDEADDLSRPRYDASMAADPDVAVYRITGAFFFGAAATVGNVLDRIADRHKAFVIDFSAVPFIDSTAANAIESVARKAHKNGVLLLVSGASAETTKTLTAHGVQGPEVRFVTSLDDAVAAAHAAVGSQSAI